MRLPGSILLTFIVMLLFAGCTTPMRPTVTRGADVILSEKPTILISTRRQLRRIEQSLRGAGLESVSSLPEANYELQVDVGNSRGNFGACGITTNVIYTLSRKGTRLLVIRGRGMTGPCDTDIFSEMSRKLATLFKKED